MVDRAFGEVAEFVHDVLDGGVLVAFGHEQLLRGVENAIARHLGVCVTCRAGLPPVCGMRRCRSLYIPIDGMYSGSGEPSTFSGDC